MRNTDYGERKEQQFNFSYFNMSAEELPEPVKVSIDKVETSFPRQMYL